MTLVACPHCGHPDCAGDCPRLDDDLERDTGCSWDERAYETDRTALRTNE